jgi:hypothetical protein
MPARKAKADKPVVDSSKRVGRPSNNSIEDSHPRLQPNFFKSQPMVYDTTIEPPRIEFEYMLRMLQNSIDDKDNQWAFMLRQLVDVFIILAYDKLKGRSDDLTVTAQCEAMVIEFEGSISTLHLKEDLSSILCNQFTGHKLPSEFHDHVNALRDMTPVTDKKTWTQWIKENHSKCGSYNTQQCKNLYFGHWLLNRAKTTTADIKNMYNPLWEPLQIPSGHSVTDMIRAIRWHIAKIRAYTLLIQAYRRREEYRTNVWDTEEKRLKYVDAQAENLEITFTSTTYPSGFLAFLICSHPIDYVMQRRMSIPLLVPPMTMEEEAQFADDAVDEENHPAAGGKKGLL